MVREISLPIQLGQLEISHPPILQPFRGERFRCWVELFGSSFDFETGDGVHQWNRTLRPEWKIELASIDI
jgi:hypothetical protein